MKNTTHHMNELEKLAKKQQTTYLERSPPTLWAQSLTEIEMQVRFALRHGVPGCINVFDLNITFTKDTLNLTGFCYEGDLKMKYVLNLHLWGTIDPEESYYEELSVGVIYIKLTKDPAPGRWMTLCFDERPENIMLWYEKHQKHYYRLEEFEDDDIIEYDGWDIESDEDDEEEDIEWNRPIVRKKQLDKKSKAEIPKPKPKKKKKKASKEAKKGKKGKKGSKKKKVKKAKK
jgi:hypothetical protein